MKSVPHNLLTWIIKLMSFASFAPEPMQAKQSDPLTVISNQLRTLGDLLNEDFDGKQRHQKLKECRDLATLIQKDLQTQIKKGDNSSQYMRLMRLHQQHLKKLQSLENITVVDEETSLLQEQEQDVDIQIFQENTQQRKQRLQNVHRNLAAVKNVFERMSEVAEKQVDQMFGVEQNYNYTLERTGQAASELLKAQNNQKSKISQRLIVIFILIAILCALLFK